jgi:hypothetical protein
MLTGHLLGGGSPSTPTISPFNAAWQFSVAFIYGGAGILLAIPIAALLFRRTAPRLAAMCFGAVALVVVGAIAWGARLGDFNMYHAFFGGLAVIATPIAAVAAWMLFDFMRKARRLRLLAFGAVALFVAQVGVGISISTFRLQESGPRRHNSPISVTLLDAIRQLPPDAKLAYACRPYEEFAFTDPSLLSIDAHTGRRVVPMCFQADVFSTLNGGSPSVNVPAAGFTLAPQAELYPNAAADPSSTAVANFLSQHGIRYVYADANHPNSLVPNASPIAEGGEGKVLKVPEMR